MKKQIYSAPTAECVRFAPNDIISTSGNLSDLEFPSILPKSGVYSGEKGGTMSVSWSDLIGDGK
jgi:hypothetical protein